jgi:hypothetical protein
MYAYLFGTSAVAGLDVLGESQLIGYPSINFPRGPPYTGPWTAPPQYPSVSLLSWGGAFGAPGDGTARYWALKLLVDSFTAGPPAGTAAPADADVLVATATGPPLTSPFCGSVPGGRFPVACMTPPRNMGRYLIVAPVRSAIAGRRAQAR